MTTYLLRRKRLLAFSVETWITFLFSLCLMTSSAIAVPLSGFSPNSPVQPESWMCGPSAAALMMQHYHSDLIERKLLQEKFLISVECGDDFEQFKKSCPLTING